MQAPQFVPSNVGVNLVDMPVSDGVYHVLTCYQRILMIRVSPLPEGRHRRKEKGM